MEAGRTSRRHDRTTPRAPLRDGVAPRVPTGPVRLSVPASLAAATGRHALLSRLRNVGHLVTGNVANAALMLVGAIVAARALGPELFGVLTLVLALGRTTERLLRFDAWQALVRFATLLEDRANARTELGRLFAFGFALDMGAALVSALAAVALAALLGPSLGLPPNGTTLVAIYAVALLCNWTGAPTAILRLAGRFRLMAYYQFAASTLRVVLALACWAWGAGVLGFVIVWTATQVLNALLLTALALCSLRDQDIAPPWRVSPRAVRAPVGFMPFAFSTSLSTTLRTLTTEADVLLIGWLAGPSAAGFYHIAKRLAKVAQQVGAHVQAVLYPDLARMWSREERGAFAHAVRQVRRALTGAGAALLMLALVAGAPLIEFAFGTAYGSVHALLVVQMLAATGALNAAPSRSALLATNRPNRVLGLTAIGTAGFFAVAFLLVPSWGALGASTAHAAMASFLAIAFARALEGDGPAGPVR